MNCIMPRPQSRAAHCFFYQQAERRLGLPCSSCGFFFHRFSCSVLVFTVLIVCVCVCACARACVSQRLRGDTRAGLHPPVPPWPWVWMGAGVREAGMGRAGLGGAGTCWCLLLVGLWPSSTPADHRHQRVAGQIRMSVWLFARPLSSPPCTRDKQAQPKRSLTIPNLVRSSNSQKHVTIRRLLYCVCVCVFGSQRTRALNAMMACLW